ncbi:MAG TPA: hypothetical protein VKH37_02960 [Ferruginibacter sp.]|nr:hypothetical protein [Ferruginibacter sp.]
MKRNTILILAILVIIISSSSCIWRHNHHSWVNVTESNDEYQMCASYDKHKARRIQNLLKQEFEHDCDESFSSARIDEEITLDDNSTFYIRSRPGEIRIRVDKDDNSEAAVVKIRAVCDDIKEILEDR